VLARPLTPPLTGWQSASGFLAMTHKTMLARVGYRSATLMALASNALGYAVILLVWSEVYREAPENPLLSRATLFAHLMLAFLLNFAITSSVERRFAERVRLGLVTSDLLRPIGFLPYQAAGALGDVASNASLAVPAYLLGIWFLGGALVPDNLAAFGLGLVSGALAMLVNFGISYLLVQACFVTHSLYGVYFTRIALHQTFSGLVAPLALFPPALKRVAEFLPFRHVIDTPVSIWLGHVEWRAASALVFEQACWAALLLFTGMGLLGLVLRQHQVQGG